jgi:septal ring factor EnvC (AmiA/AmiB activator)
MLASLQTQAEVLTERYDETQVNEQRAASAYRVTEARLGQAERQQDASRQRLARLAAEEFESGGGFDSVTAMLGDAPSRPPTRTQVQPEPTPRPAGQTSGVSSWLSTWP